MIARSVLRLRRPSALLVTLALTIARINEAHSCPTYRMCWAGARA